LGLRMNNLVPKLFGLCYDSGIVSLSLHLSPCLDMVLLEFLLPATLKNVANSLSMFYRCLRFRLLTGIR
jgi:hypothetical protein